jgi:2-polyprenyl-6-methoxyphenol hydroxylase-like FAD-dependent oxidoreductase
MDANVLIAGAGPTGLFLASELARLGVPVTVIEKGEGLSVNSKALTIHARTLEAFSTRGLAAPFVKKGLETERVRIFVGGTQRAELPLYEIDSAYAYILILPQSDTEEMLLERFQSLGGTVQWGTELVDLTVEDDQVMARVADGEGERRLQAQWLVGCDGAHSRVRRAHEIEWTGDDIDLHFALMDAHLQSEVIEDETFQVFVLEDGRVAGFIPLPDGRQRVIMAFIWPRRGDGPGSPLLSGAICHSRARGNRCCRGRLDFALYRPSASSGDVSGWTGFSHGRRSTRPQSRRGAGHERGTPGRTQSGLEAGGRL